MSERYALCMLCMLNDLYVVGACVSAYCHRRFSSRRSRRIDLVVMCDERIHGRYGATLRRYFDRVVKVSLITLPLSPEYEFYDVASASKYSSWISYSLTKWKCLRMTRYAKVLFVDVDMLPRTSSFYDIFDFDTPAVHRVRTSDPCTNNAAFSFRVDIPYKEYIRNVESSYGAIYGGLCLFKPSLAMYKAYRSFVKELYPNGLHTTNMSGPDESSLYFFLLKSGIPMHSICTEYSVIPWERRHRPFLPKAKLYNFLSYVKPWVKPRFLCWPEELVWHDVFARMVDKTPELERLATSVKVDCVRSFLKMSREERRRYFHVSVGLEQVHRARDPDVLKDLEARVASAQGDYGVVNFRLP